MGFSSREQKTELPRWVDDGRLAWTPDVPLDGPPRVEQPPQPRADLQAQSPRPLQPQTEQLKSPPAVPRVEKRNWVARHRMSGWRRRDPHCIPHPTEQVLNEPPTETALAITPAVEPKSGAVLLEAPAPEATLSPAECPASPAARLPAQDASARMLTGSVAGNGAASGWLLPRLGIGLGQGQALLLLFLAQERGIWPASDPYLSTALLLAALLAPLALLEGLGEVETSLLLLWSGTLGFVVATLGIWLQYPGPREFMPMAAIGFLALIAHIAIRSILMAEKGGRGTWINIGWTVLVRLLAGAGITTLVFVVLASAFSGWLKMATFPLLGLANAAGIALAADGWLQRPVRSVLPVCVVITLPFLGAGLGHFLHADIPVQAPSPAGGNIVLHTAGRLPAAFLAQSWSDQKVPACLSGKSQACDAWLLDLDGDSEPEILLAHGDDKRFSANVMKLEQGRWTQAATLVAPPCPGLFSAMRRRGLLVTNPRPHWRDVMVAGMYLTPASETPAPCPTLKGEQFAGAPPPMRRAHVGTAAARIFRQTGAESL